MVSRVPAAQRMMRSPVRAACILLAVAAGMSGAHTQAASDSGYPNKPIRMVTGGIGGGIDFVTRILGLGLTSVSAQQVIVDNRPSGAVPREIVFRAAPDGYTLLVAGGSLWIGAVLQKAAFDTLRDLTPVSLVTAQPSILVVHPSVAAKSVKELIALAKARPGELNYASAATGAASHLAAELFKAMAGVNIVRISYRGNGAAYSDLIGGQIQVMFATTGGAAPHVKSGRLRPLATTSAEPSALLPGLPTVAASGLPGYESVSIVGAFAPLGTHHTLIMRINQEIANALNKPDIKDKFFTAGVETVGSTPEKLTATIHYEMTRLGKVIKDAGIRAD